ncbi:MAG: hypothetical protein B6U89_04215 [Desulfurococcales archaeon ex4484_58]|nr:MAG: hypothetical protein B6U89_04215 [Desulfurococcales archaeon ex4484_58]
MIEYLIYLLIGLLASLVGSMTGFGGGFIVIPTLYYLGLEPHLVVSSSKFMVFINSSVSSSKYMREEKFSYKLYLVIVIPMIMTAYIGAYLVAVLSSKTLSLIIGLILLIGAIKILLPTHSRESTGFKITRNKYIVAFLSGTLSGLVAGVSGLGGGVVNMPIFLHILKLDPHSAVALSMACIMPSSLISVIRHYIDKIIDWTIALPLSIGSVIGGFVGPRIALRLSREKLKRIIGIVMIIAASRILFEALFN